MSLFDTIPTPDPARFDGPEATDPDGWLSGQILRVWSLMRDGHWRTVAEIARATGDPPTSVSAQLRHLRKERFGAYRVERQAVAGARGLWRYRVGEKGAGRPELREPGPSYLALVAEAADNLLAYLRHARDCFAVNTLESDGLGHYAKWRRCRPGRCVYCGGAITVAKVASNGQTHDSCLENRRRYWHTLQRRVIDGYGGRCICCGEAEYLFLTLDHVNGNGAEHRKELGYGNRRLLLQIIALGFPDEYQVQCYNCNCGRARNGGICPHVEVLPEPVGNRRALVAA